MKSLCLAALAILGLAASPAVAADVEMWRLDCGSIHFRDVGVMSDTYDYAGQGRTLTDSCYLIRHDKTYFLWDTGLPTALLGAKPDMTAPFSPTLTRDIPSEMAQIGVKPSQVAIIGISHGHFDHLGQAASFPQATLMIGAADLAALKGSPLPFAMDPTLIAPWTKGAGKIDAVSGDRDVYGDGSVVMLAMPGHTPGEMALLVRLAHTGPVLLSGDVVHFQAQLDKDGVPPFNASRADSLASIRRLKDIAGRLGSKIIIQHDETQIGRLPAFPESAK